MQNHLSFLIQAVWITADHSNDKYTYRSLEIQLFTFQLPQDSQDMKDKNYQIK